MDRFAAPHDKARSPIVKSKKSYALPLVDSDSFHFTPAMVLALQVIFIVGWKAIGLNSSIKRNQGDIVMWKIRCHAP